MIPRMVRQTTAALEPDPGASEDGSGRPENLVESYRRLAEVFHLVLSEQSLDALLERIAETLADLMPYEALHIYEVDEDRRELIPVLARSQAYEDEIMNSRPRFGEGITGWAVENRRPVWTNQAHLDPRVITVPGTPVEPEALISVPLIARGALKGALNIYRIGEEAGFAEHEFELAKWFGDAAALAVDNAQIRARLEHLAQTDSLTGLYNHRFFHERLRAELTRASRVARLGRRADVRPRRLQARQRRLRPRSRRPAADPARAPGARDGARLRRRLPHRRRGVRRDHALVRRRRCARAGGAPDRAAQRGRVRARRAA